MLPSREQLDGLDVDNDEGGRAVELGDQAEENHTHGEVGLRSFVSKAFLKSLIIKSFMTFKYK